MIKNKINKLITAGLAAGAILAACPACTDTWDDHYELKEGFSSTATSTLWQQIESNKKLTKFANILKKAKYYKDKDHPAASFTFKDMLNGTEIFTVWAPEDDAFDQQEYQKWLSMCETDGYLVQQQFLNNHIARWRRTAAGGGIDSMTMLNNKRIIFDKNQETFKGTPLVEMNIPAKNGTLHTLQGTAPFSYNIYEYIKDNGQLSTLADYFESLDSTYFLASSSTEGPVDMNGNPTYVDSVYFTFNLSFSSYYNWGYSPEGNRVEQDILYYLKGINAELDAEDSVFAMLLPTNTAYAAAYEKLKPLYNYADQYLDKIEGNNGVTKTVNIVTSKDPLGAQKLQTASIGMDLVSPLVFNVNAQPKKGLNKFTRENFDAQKNNAEYLLTTRFDTLRTTYEPDWAQSKPVWDKSTLFGNQAPINMSNGLGYIVDDWNLPLSFYQPDVIINCNARRLYDVASLEGKTTATDASFNNTLYGDWVNQTGKVHEEDYMTLRAVSATGDPECYIPIKGSKNSADIMSGKYDVYIVLVPYYYQFQEDPSEWDEEQQKLFIKRNKFRVKLCYNNNKTNSKGESLETETSWSKTIDYDGTKVDTIRIFENFEFPYSYRNLNNSYPTLRFQSNTSNADLKGQYTNEVRLDQIFFISKEDQKD